MPLYLNKKIDLHTSLRIWKIEESLPFFLENCPLKEISLERLNNMKSESHKKGFLAVRMLLQDAGYNDYDLFYDEFGKPHLNDFNEISISHSFDFSVIIISKQKMGIDLEILKPKILTIAPRFMDCTHLENLDYNEQIMKATVIWGVKESIFKIKNEKGISFPKHISEQPFQLNDSNGIAELHFKSINELFDFSFMFVQNYALVITKKRFAN